MQLDSRTIAVVGTLTALVVSLLGLLLWQTRRTYPGFRRWTLGNLCVSVSLLFLCARGAVPDIVSVAGTNAGAFLAAVLLLEGTREFRGSRPRCWPAYVLVGCGMIAQLYWLLGVNNLAARIVVVSVCLGPLGLATAFTLLRGIATGHKLGYWFAGSLFLANGIFNLVRGLITCLRWPAADLFAPTVMNQLYFVGMVLTVIGWAFGFILLTNDRLVQDLLAEEQRGHRLNRELERAVERATKADEAKTEFLAHMSHEIRTPLAGMIGLTELVLDGPLTEAQRPELTTAREAAHGLLGIVNDILDLSKIETGQLTVTPAPFDLHSELHQIVALYEPQAAAKATNLVLEYSDTAPRWFHGDAMRVRQIVANFTANAVKFTEGGEIKLGMSHNNAGVRICVRDTGIGIAPETLPRLFSRFIQADASTARRYGGSGLGLAICKNLAEVMGGSVGATSVAGRGSTFWVELPLDRVEAPAKLAVGRDRVEACHFAGSHVLVAEDNRVNQHVIVKLLEKHGLLIDVASNGREAVARHAQGHYDLILMDCQMPVMDGYEAARAIRQEEQHTSRHTPIIAITANAMSRERDRCMAAGMDHYLIKPVQAVELFNCISQCVKPRATQSSVIHSS